MLAAHTRPHHKNEQIAKVGDGKGILRGPAGSIRRLAIENLRPAGPGSGGTRPWRASGVRTALFPLGRAGRVGGLGVGLLGKPQSEAEETEIKNAKPNRPQA